jgi:hypothetical protein
MKINTENTSIKNKKKPKLTPAEARKSLENYKEKVNFNQYGNPVDRMRLFEVWANNALGMTFDEANKYLEQNN